MAHHAAASGQHAVAAEHAVRAAGQAARLGAHRQAAEQYRLALRMPGAHDAEGRRRLFGLLSYECYLTDELAEALAAQHQSMELAELAGDAAAVGASQRWLSRLSWFLGRGADSLRYGTRAVAALEPLGDGHELGMAYSNLAQLAMLAGDAPTAVHWGERAVALARRIGDVEVEIHALNNVGSALSLVDDSLEARAQLNRSLELALANDAHEHAARAYTNLGSTALRNGRYADAEGVLRRGIAYCIERDLDAWDHYMSAVLAAVLAALGRYDEARRTATVVRQHPRLSPISEIPALAVLAQLALRSGEDASALIGRAAELAEGTGETQRMVPVALARAEQCWLDGAGRPGRGTRGRRVAGSRRVPEPVGARRAGLVGGRRGRPPAVADAGRAPVRAHARRPLDRGGGRLA